jgi:hypothetical protein
MIPAPSSSSTGTPTDLVPEPTSASVSTNRLTESIMTIVHNSPETGPRRIVASAVNILGQLINFPFQMLRTLQLAELQEPDILTSGSPEARQAELSEAEQEAELPAVEQEAELSAAEQEAELSVAEQEAELSVAEQEAELSVAEQEAELSEIEQETNPQFQFIDHLPLDLLEKIFILLDPPSILALSATSSYNNTFYKKNILKKLLLPLLDKPMHTPNEHAALVKVYPSLLSFLFKEVLNEENGMSKLQSSAALVEKFFKHLSNREIQGSMHQAFEQEIKFSKNKFKDAFNRTQNSMEGPLRESPNWAQIKFDYLARLNLPLTLSLMATLSSGTFNILGLSYDFVAPEIYEIYDDVDKANYFFALLHESSESSALHFVMKHITRDNSESLKFSKIMNLFLRESPSSINLTNIEGDTLLIAACKGDMLDFNHTKMDLVKTLIESQADINMQNKQGYTALMYAIIFGKRSLVELLLAHGADKTLKNNEGKTALELAQASFPQIVFLLADN